MVPPATTPRTGWLATFSPRNRPPASISTPGKAPFIACWPSWAVRPLPARTPLRSASSKRVSPTARRACPPAGDRALRRVTGARRGVSVARCARSAARGRRSARRRRARSAPADPPRRGAPRRPPRTPRAPYRPGRTSPPAPRGSRAACRPCFTPRSTSPIGVTGAPAAPMSSVPRVCGAALGRDATRSAQSYPRAALQPRKRRHERPRVRRRRHPIESRLGPCRAAAATGPSRPSWLKSRGLLPYRFPLKKGEHGYGTDEHLLELQW